MLTRALRMIAATHRFCVTGGQHSVSALPVAPFLTKLAKHLALLVCLAIVGQATGRAAIGPDDIFSAWLSPPCFIHRSRLSGCSTKAANRSRHEP